MRRAWRLLLLVVLVGVAERGADVIDPYPLHLLDRFSESRQVTGRDGELLRLVPTADGERRIHMDLDDFSPHVRAAVVAAEDRRFGEHSGVDAMAMVLMLCPDIPWMT